MSHFWLFVLSLLDHADSPRAVELGEIIGVKPMGFREIALNNRWDLLENYLNFGELKS